MYGQQMALHAVTATNGMESRLESSSTTKKHGFQTHAKKKDKAVSVFCPLYGNLFEKKRKIEKKAS